MSFWSEGFWEGQGTGPGPGQTLLYRQLSAGADGRVRVSSVSAKQVLQVLSVKTAVNQTTMTGIINERSATIHR